MADTPSTEGAPEALPENLDIHEAARMMDGIADEPGEGDEQPDTDNAQPEGGEVAAPEDGDQPEGEEQPEEQAAPEADSEAPEFWSAEDKAAWATVPPALRPLIQKYEQKRVQFEQEKAREAAEVRKAAAEEVQKVSGVVDEAAKWWQANGPQFFKAFGDKWAQVNWVELSEKDPAECQRLTILRDQEAALLRQAHEKGQRDIEAANKRVAAQIDELKRTEHEKVAAKLPEYFGTIEKATQTYKDLSEYLFSKGIPAERISQIHEAPIIEMALNSMRFERAQKQASTVVTRDAATGKFTAKTAPTRVQPGPATRQGAGDRNVEQARRVGERFRKTEGADIRDMAELIRLNGL
jgi:hypothetical protein